MEDDLGNTALINHINLCKDNNLPNFKIAIYTITNQGAKKWMKDSRFEEIRVPKSYSIGGHNITLPIRSVELRNGCYSTPRSELGGKTDESVFLNNEEINLISEKEPDPINKDFITSPDRQFPALILYFFALTEIKPFGKLSTPHEITEINVPFGNQPVIGYSISFLS